MPRCAFVYKQHRIKEWNQLEDTVIFFQLKIWQTVFWQLVLLHEFSKIVLEALLLLPGIRTEAPYLWQELLSYVAGVADILWYFPQKH